MKRIVCLCAALLTAAIAGAQVVEAQRKKEVRFVKESAEIDEEGKLQLKFKLAGLKEYEEVKYDVTGDVTVTEACQTNGGTFPSDPKKQLEDGPVYKEAEGTADVKGTVEGEVILEPLDTSLECNGEQQDVLVKVEYDVTLDIKLAEETLVKEYKMVEEYYFLK